MKTLTRAALAATAILLLLLVAPLSPATAQDTTAPADTLRHSDDDSLYTWEYVRRNARPALGVQYGFGDVDRHGFGGELASVGSFDVRLGYRIEQPLAGKHDLLRQVGSAFLLGNIASRLHSDLPSPSEIGTDMWRFGAASGSGSGYRFSAANGHVGLQNVGTVAWYTLELDGDGVAALPADELRMLEQFTSHTRFGESWESAVEVGLGNMLAVRAGYERVAVFPSFKIWYWLLSGAIDQAALALANVFADRVEDSSPYASPILRFVLVAAVQYGYYELRSEEVNWPFETEAPLDYQLLNLGLTARF